MPKRIGIIRADIKRFGWIERGEIKNKRYR